MARMDRRASAIRAAGRPRRPKTPGPRSADRALTRNDGARASGMSRTFVGDEGLDAAAVRD